MEDNVKETALYKHDERTKRVRRRIEEHLRQKFTQEQVYALALILGVDTGQK